MAPSNTFVLSVYTAEMLRFKTVSVRLVTLIVVCVGLTAALVWQLMRAYTLSLLNKLKVLDQSSKSTDQQIVSWANNKVRYM